MFVLLSLNTAIGVNEHEDNIGQNESTPLGINGLRFETTATATGDRNKGRFCLGDIVFSTSSDNSTLSYVDYNYMI